MANFNSIGSVTDIDAASILAELQAFLSGEFNLSELPYDQDLLRSSYIDHIEKSDSDLYEEGYLQQEPATCLSDARSQVEEETSHKLIKHSGMIKDHYPFEISGSASNVLTKKDNITPVGLSYIWLRFYELYRYHTYYVQFSDSGNDNEENKFKKAFEKIFEFLAVFAVAGKYQSTAAWMTAASRSVDKFLSILNSICLYVENGKVKLLADLAANQKTTNDGRIDAIVITQPAGDINVDSELYLVQATIQKNNIMKKTVTLNEIVFFEDFFIKKIDISKKGILVVPHRVNELHKSECTTANCVYMPLGTLYRNIGDAVIDGEMTAIGNGFTAQYSDIEAHGFSCQKFNY